jgi:hypothetical protein
MHDAMHSELLVCRSSTDMTDLEEALPLKGLKKIVDVESGQHL